MVKATDRAKNPARSSVWLENRAARSGGGPAGLDRDRIVAAAIRMLDEEGLAKLSMRKLATELNVTAMSLYWYVDTKDDIIEFALDAAHQGIDLEAVEAARSWQDRLRLMANDYRRMLVAHPWVSSISGTYLNVGPQAVAVAKGIYQVIASTGLPADGQPGATSAVFQFVYGFGTVEGHFERRAAETGMTQEEYYREAVDAFVDEPRFAEDLKLMRPVIEERASRRMDDLWDRDFDYALDVLIAGIEVMVSRAQEKQQKQETPETPETQRMQEMQEK
ncbi:TetR/AcrR family transcriptional regulator [Streptomyces showdoensis]|uniref:TetR family transcriptional regulator n=1 Tax=Streptomyces showdoensis TaxID=68268 RepID=A0A2P2GE25_STREW|nr:TetR/AcrR family transcriptional regulator C-terminal domain-containing protein [Streptomyces showdoensis]KKZ69784.1 TetR family transcriptional regulator [Streptomyces showdoensis]